MTPPRPPRARVPPQSRRGSTLTARERQIAELVALGHANKQIAATLYLSEKTVRNALTRIYAKLGVRSRTQLATYAASTCPVNTSTSPPPTASPTPT